MAHGQLPSEHTGEHTRSTATSKRETLLRLNSTLSAGDQAATASTLVKGTATFIRTFETPTLRISTGRTNVPGRATAYNSMHAAAAYCTVTAKEPFSD